MTGNEEEGYYEENPEDELVEEIVGNVAKEEDMDKDAHDGFIISG